MSMKLITSAQPRFHWIIIITIKWLKYDADCKKVGHKHYFQIA